MFSNKLNYVNVLQKDLDAASPDIVKLGLLSELGSDAATITEQPALLCFAHKLLQEWFGAYYIAKCQKGSNSKKVKKKFIVNSIIIEQMI